MFLGALQLVHACQKLSHSPAGTLFGTHENQMPLVKQPVSNASTVSCNYCSSTECISSVKDVLAWLLSQTLNGEINLTTKFNKTTSDMCHA